MSPYLHQLSLLVRTRLTTMGLAAASVPFTRMNVQMELLVGAEARAQRLLVAAETLPQMFDASNGSRKKRGRGR